MPEHRLPLFVPRRATSDGTTNVVLKTDRVPRGEVWHITHVAWENETSAFTSARTFRRTEQAPAWLKEQLTPAAGLLYWDSDEHWLAEGEEFGVRFTGTTSGDVLTATIEGWRELLPPPSSAHLRQEA